MGYFYLFSLAANITDSYVRVISEITEVISLNFAELYSQLFFPLDSKLETTMLYY